MRRRIVAALLVLLWAIQVQAQGTGVVFPTPGGQIAPGMMVLVPAGPIVNGQPTAAPPGPANGLAVTCTNCSPSAPVTASSNPVSGTIAVTNTFQTLLASNGGRRACVFQNNGAHTMYFSLAVTPTLGNSLQVLPGVAYYCAGLSNVVVGDTISITGTAGDAFAGYWQ